MVKCPAKKFQEHDPIMKLFRLLLITCIPLMSFSQKGIDTIKVAFMPFDSTTLTISVPDDVMHYDMAVCCSKAPMKEQDKDMLRIQWPSDNRQIRYAFIFNAHQFIFAEFGEAAIPERVYFSKAIKEEQYRQICSVIESRTSQFATCSKKTYCFDYTDYRHEIMQPSKHDDSGNLLWSDEQNVLFTNDVLDKLYSNFNAVLDILNAAVQQKLYIPDKDSFLRIKPIKAGIAGSSGLFNLIKSDKNFITIAHSVYDSTSQCSYYSANAMNCDLISLDISGKRTIDITWSARFNDDQINLLISPRQIVLHSSHNNPNMDVVYAIVPLTQAQFDAAINALLRNPSVFEPLAGKNNTYSFKLSVDIKKQDLLEQTNDQKEKTNDLLTLSRKIHYYNFSSALGELNKKIKKHENKIMIPGQESFMNLKPVMIINPGYLEKYLKGERELPF